MAEIKRDLSKPLADTFVSTPKKKRNPRTKIAKSRKVGDTVYTKDGASKVTKESRREGIKYARGKDKQFRKAIRNSASKVGGPKKIKKVYSGKDMMPKNSDGSDFFPYTAFKRKN